MDGLYEAIVDAALRAKSQTGDKAGTEYFRFHSHGHNVRIDANFDGENLASMRVEAHTNRKGALSEAFSKYCDGPVLFTMHNHVEDLFRVQVGPDGSLLGLTKFSENIDKDGANALMEVLDVLGITYERENGGRPLVDREKIYRRITPETVEAAMDTMKSRTQYHSRVSGVNRDLNVGIEADGDRMSVYMKFDEAPATGGSGKTKTKVNELQTIIEKDENCKCEGFIGGY